MKSTETVLTLIEGAYGHIEATLMCPSPNFDENDANYLRSVLKECKLQIEHLDKLVKEERENVRT